LQRVASTISGGKPARFAAGALRGAAQQNAPAFSKHFFQIMQILETMDRDRLQDFEQDSFSLFLFFDAENENCIYVK
jgi:hypothetical protein